MRYFAAIFFLFAAITASAQLTVHEWGTFTTLRGSDGSVLSGLYIEEEQLPPFVYHHPGFSPDPIIQTNGYRPVKDVTVKMETPVLYFYSQIEKNVKVHVDFPNGTISQWYPERSGGELTPTSDTLDLGKPMAGSIDWDVTVLAPDTKETYTENQNINLKWYHPRQTDANLVKNHTGQVEKYLFYRGLANFSLPIEIHWNDKNTLEVKNSSNWDVPFIYIYDYTENNQIRIWGTGPMVTGETKTFTKPDTTYGYDQGTPAYQKFRQALQDAGLTYKEAESMLQTWTDGYFQTQGFKVFWVVPRALTDMILPINIIPVPDSLERVLVGKSEIMTPALEAELVADYKTENMEKWKNHHYYHAFIQRIGQLAQLSVEHTSSKSSYTLAPNPATSYTHIFGKENDMMSISIRTPLGVEVMNTVTSGAIDIHSLASGMYFVTVSANGKTETLKLVKE
ncbi:MAG TPA: T9SS type A sorting domain-containing protein [Candidatus Kapabacteria bacterium]